MRQNKRESGLKTSWNNYQIRKFKFLKISKTKHSLNLLPLIRGSLPKNRLNMSCQCKELRLGSIYSARRWKLTQVQTMHNKWSKIFAMSWRKKRRRRRLKWTKKRCKRAKSNKNYKCKIRKKREKVRNKICSKMIRHRPEKKNRKLKLKGRKMMKLKMPKAKAKRGKNRPNPRK